MDLWHVVHVSCLLLGSLLCAVLGKLLRKYYSTIIFIDHGSFQQPWLCGNYTGAAGGRVVCVQRKTRGGQRSRQLRLGHTIRLSLFSEV